MKRKKKIGLLLAIFLAFIGLAVWYFQTHTVEVLSPAGTLASKERHLIYIALLLSIVVVLPVFALAIGIAWRYREGANNKKYQPDWDHGRWLEGVWWAIPLFIITILSVITWNSSHALDPFKSLASNKPPLNVEVIALDWKWLFIYPSQHIASVNQMAMPLNVPVNLQITSDTVMNSFWVPQLSGQIYAMPGMDTQLHIMATKTGSYNGSSANISGNGFAGMTFTAKAMDQTGFNSWVNSVRKANDRLTMKSYAELSEPSEYNPVKYYGWVDPNLYNNTVMKYMMSTPS